MRNLLLCGAATALAMTAIPAHAETFGTHHDPAWTAAWNGPYAGAEGNYVAGGSDLRGWGGGGFAGYGWTPRNVPGIARPYVGVEAGFDWSGADSDTLSEKKKAMISARPGAIFGDNVLGYGILGYSRADFKSNVNNDNNWAGGWSVGGGVEVASFTPSLPLGARLEYVYTNYNNTNLGGISTDPHDNAVKLGVLYHFR